MRRELKVVKAQIIGLEHGDRTIDALEYKGGGEQWWMEWRWRKYNGEPQQEVSP